MKVYDCLKANATFVMMHKIHSSSPILERDNKASSALFISSRACSKCFPYPANLKIPNERDS